MNIKLENKTLKGGTYLGSGAYGCVVSPPLPCKSYDKKTKKQSNIKLNKNKKYVSKILKSEDEDSRHELKISDKIKKIDPSKKYFITYESACKIKTVPKNRNNTVKVEFRNNDLSYYNEINNNGKIKYSGYTNDHNNNSNNKKKRCLIDTSIDPINIIMPYGGYDLIDLKYNIYEYYYYLKKYKNTKDKKYYTILKNHKYINSMQIYDLLNNNFKYYFKNLVIGLYKLHKNRIVNLDIKKENIMVNYDSNTKKLQLRYIDFGMSQHLTDYYCKNYDNIDLFGTYELIPPEIFICYIINKYNKIKSESYIVNKIYDYIDKNVYSLYKEIKEYNNINILYNEHINKTTKQKENPLILKLYVEINKYFQNKTILNHYFGLKNVKSNDGFLQKRDVYSLGIAMYNYLIDDFIVIDIKKPENIKLYTLLKKMIDPDPNQRYNIDDCLKDPYFN
jgi:serine/threonine protein kinase